MNIKVKRYSNEPEVTEDIVEYSIPHENLTLLEALNHIKTKIDASLSFSSGCRSAVCGSCAVRVNGTEELACTYKVSEGDMIEPLNNLPVLRDLIVDVDKMMQYNLKAKAWSSENNENIAVTPEQAEANEVQSDCILCGSCFSAWSWHRDSSRSGPLHI